MSTQPIRSPLYCCLVRRAVRFIVISAQGSVFTPLKVIQTDLVIVAGGNTLKEAGLDPRNSTPDYSLSGVGP